MKSGPCRAETFFDLERQLWRRRLLLESAVTNRGRPRGRARAEEVGPEGGAMARRRHFSSCHLPRTCRSLPSSNRSAWAIRLRASFPATFFTELLPSTSTSVLIVRSTNCIRQNSTRCACVAGRRRLFPVSGHRSGDMTASGRDQPSRLALANQRLFGSGTISTRKCPSTCMAVTTRPIPTDTRTSTSCPARREITTTRTRSRAWGMENRGRSISPNHPPRCGITITRWTSRRTT